MGISILQSNINHQPTFGQIVDQLGLTYDNRRVLDEIVIEKVEVFPKSKRWLLYLRFDSIVKDWLLVWGKMNEAILTRVPILKTIDYRSHYQCISNDLSFFVQELGPVFLDRVIEKMPSSAGWLGAAQLEANGEGITVKVSNNLGMQFMLEKDIEEMFVKTLQEQFGLETRFVFSVDETLASNLNSEPLQLLDSLRARAAVVKAQGKSVSSQTGGTAPLLGRKISRNSTPIAQIVDEERGIIIEGQVVKTEARELKSGRFLFTWDLCDLTDSISIKAFSDEKSEQFLASIRDNDWLLVQGPVQHDRYTQELTLMARDINRAKPVIREDTAPEKRVELHVHTKMSALDAVVEVKDIVKTAARWGHAAIAITDHGVVQGFPDAYEAGKRHGIKIIYGLEGYLYDGEEQKQERYHIVILAKNQVGLGNLYRLITLSHLEHFYRRPRIPRAGLEQLREGLLLGTACEAGELIQGYLAGKPHEELCRIASFYDYIEIQPIENNQFLINKGDMASQEDLKTMNKKLVELAKELGKPVVATGDVHFLNPEDAIYRKILQTGQGYSDTEQSPLFLKTTEEMLADFSYLGKDLAREVVIENTVKINNSIEVLSPLPKGLFAPEIPGAAEEVAFMCRQEAVRLYGDPLPIVVEERLNKELTSIISNGFAVLYYIAHKLVKKSNDDGYLVGSRGSVGSSLVATFCGITEVNPLPPHYRCGYCEYSEFITDGSYNSGSDLADKKCPICNELLGKEGHDIPFETFLGFEGDKVPDIDLNFSGEYQSLAHKYAEELFGSEYVFRAGTIATVAEKTAFGFVKKYLEQTETYKRNAEISRLVKGCSGVKRTTGQHPGGLMVVPKNMDIHQFTPLQRPADDTKSGVITTHFDYHSVSNCLVKLDILGHDDPTVIKMLEDLTGFSAETIALDDEKTLSLFSGVEVLGVTAEQIRSSVGTYGIPEFGTRFVRKMLEDTKPKHFSELVRISGFSHGTDVWLNNAQELIKNGTAKLSEAISTRDDIMLYLIHKGMPSELSFKIMEDVRKGKGLKLEYEEIMREYGVPAWYIKSCKKIKYMFPKAHAVAYVTMAFRIAYFKVNFPLAFYASFFTVKADEFDAHLIVQGSKIVEKTIEEIERKGNDASPKEKNLLTILEVALEMMARGFSFKSVDLERSDAFQFIIEGDGLLAPFASLQGIGKNAAQNLSLARKEKRFTSVEDMRHRGKASKTVVEALDIHGTLKGLELSDQLSMF